MKKIRVAFHTLGCKLNFSETSTISRQFDPEHFELVDFSEPADIYVIHTCSVTAAAEKKCRQTIRAAHHQNPAARIAVMGCAVQAHAGLFAAMEGVTWVLGNEEKFNLGNLIQKSETDYHSNPFPAPAEMFVNDIGKTKSFHPSYSINDRTRSFFKVQDGCDYFCTYCSIPFMRGRSRSDSIENTLEVAREIAATEAKEIILTGVNIGDFGKHQEESFLQLLKELEKLEGIERIRISSIEPELLTHEIIELVANSAKLLPHFHIPLQSGCNKILQLMKRKYPRELYAERVLKIKELMPDACIASDVIVGFPNESADDFLDTCRFIESLPISYLHVFTYSERSGTRSLQLDEKVNPAEKQGRSQALHQLSEQKKEVFYQSQAGKTRSVLWESDLVDGKMQGWTDNYIKVSAPYCKQLVNQIQLVTLENLRREKELCFECGISLNQPGEASAPACF